MARPLPELLAVGVSVVVADQARAIERRAGTDEAPIVRLSGSSSREDAEALRGQALLVAEADAPALAEGEFWAHELEGCRVVDGGVEARKSIASTECPSASAFSTCRCVRNHSNHCGNSVKTSALTEEP